MAFRKEVFISGSVKLAADTAEGIMVDADGTVSDATGTPFGVTLESGKAGTHVAVLRMGFFKAVASAAIAKGDKLMPAASGNVAKLAGATGVNIDGIGMAESAADAAGDVIGAYFNFVNVNTVRI